MFMILQGCVHIHANGIVHRDFKFENILVDKTEGKLKIIDFGMSKNENEVQHESLNLRVGSNLYMAPEIFLEEGNYDSYPCDIWAIGIMMYFMICGEYPFDADTDKKLKKNIKKKRL